MSNIKDRLTKQLAARGVKNAEGMAMALLTKRGQIAKGKLTKEGKKRQDLGNAGRAKDRAAKYAKGKSSEYIYNKKTNMATKKPKD